MPTPQPCETDQRSSEELVAACRAAWAREDYDCDAFAPLHHRGGVPEFRLGCELTASPESFDRQIGARILGQLGWGRKCFHEECMDILLNLLTHEDAETIAAAVWALGHRGDDRAVEPMIALAGHPCDNVRYAVASSLPSASFDSPKAPLAAASLIPLCTDPDFDTRNWAVFGLAQMRDEDTPEIRAALATALTDPDYEISGEALVGLAIRKVPGICECIRERLAAHWLHCLTLEAAAELGDSSLIPDLDALLPEFASEPGGGIRSYYESALRTLREHEEQMRAPAQE